MVYKWKIGSHINIDPQVAGEVCMQMEKRNELTARNLLDCSRDESAPLHDAFEWDDKIAGEQWRLQQAGHIIRCIVRCNDSEEQENKEKDNNRLFFIVKESPQADTQTYRSVDVILDNRDFYQDALCRAKRELSSIIKKYNYLKQLDDIARAIDGIGGGE